MTPPVPGRMFESGRLLSRTRVEETRAYGSAWLLDSPCCWPLVRRSQPVRRRGAPSEGPRRAARILRRQWRAEGDVKPGPMDPGGKMTPMTHANGSRESSACSAAMRVPAHGPEQGSRHHGDSTEEKVYTYYAADNMIAMSSVPKEQCGGIPGPIPMKRRLEEPR